MARVCKEKSHRNLASMKISIIIVSYNTRDLLVGCLNSIFEFLDADMFEAIVVDNGSSDGTCLLLKSNYDNIKLIENKSNLGFGRSNNIGAQVARGKYLWFLNSDTFLIDGRITDLVEAMDANEEIGVASPFLVMEDKKTEQVGSYGNNPSILTLLKNHAVKNAEKNSKEFFRVDWVTGAAMLVKRSIFNQVGGFDDRFFMYYEDVDLCMEIRRAGYKVTYWPKYKVVHIAGKSWKEDWKKKNIYYVNQELYFRKHYGRIYTELMKLIRWPYKMKVMRSLNCSRQDLI